MQALDVNRRIARFSDLSKAYHSAGGKVLVCQECIASGLDSKTFARNHSIPETSMLRMMRQHQADTLSGISTFRDSGSGRPPKLDATAKEAISELLQKRRRDQKAPNRAEFQSIVLEEVEQTSKRRNVADTRPQLSSQALRRYKKSMDLGERVAQLKTSARIDAEKDPRNSFAMAAMIEAFFKHSPHPCSSTGMQRSMRCRQTRMKSVYIKKEQTLDHLHLRVEVALFSRSSTTFFTTRVVNYSCTTIGTVA